MYIIADPWFYVLAVPGILLTGISKGGFAGGLSFLAVTLMAIVIPPAQAAAIVLPTLCLMDVVGFWSWRRHWDLHLFGRLMPWALLGIVIGTLMFDYLNEDVVKAMIGLLAFVFALNYYLKGRIKALWHLPEKISAALWSSLSGFTSFVSHAGGPPIMIYLLPKQLDKSVLVATLTLLFTVINYVKLVPYAYLGQLSLTNLATALILAPLAPIGVRLGMWLHDRIEAAMFYRLSYAFVFITGIKLCWDSFSKLL